MTTDVIGVPPEVGAERRHIVAEHGQIGVARRASDPDRRHGPDVQWSRVIEGRSLKCMRSAERWNNGSGRSMCVRSET